MFLIRNGKESLDTLSDMADEEALGKRSLGTLASVGQQLKISGPTAHAIAHAGCLVHA